MTIRNARPLVESEQLDVDHELPAADDTADYNAASPGLTAKASFSDDGSEERAERDALLDRLARLQAEFDNARKRAVREEQEFRDFALTHALKTLLPVLDSFDRALRTSTPSLEEFRSGVELISRQLQDALAKLGLRPVPAAGEPFNPQLHEAVEVVDSAAANNDQVLEELQRGYKLNNRLLRPAMVRVARNPDQQNAGQQNGAAET
jgi:molecular chaperone GrpE